MNDEQTAAAYRRLEPVALEGGDRDAVKQLADLMLRSGGDCRLLGPLGEEISLPAPLYYVLERVAEMMARGDAVTIVPVGQKLTTQQAANILNISRQYLVRLLDNGDIPFEKIGTHRRLDVQDVLEFKRERNLKRKIELDKLTALSEECGGYTELD